MKTGSLLSHSQ